MQRGGTGERGRSAGQRGGGRGGEHERGGRGRSEPLMDGRGGRDGMGRGMGRGRGDPGMGPAERIGSPGEAQLGTAARPGVDVTLPGADDMARDLAANIAAIPRDLMALSLSKPKPPAPGKEGKVVKLKANHFKVMCNLKQAFHYDVKIISLRRGGPPAAEGSGTAEGPRSARPERPLPAAICRRVMLALAEQETWPQHAWAYDGQSALYTSQSFLPTVESAYEVWICPPSKESVFVPAVEANDGERARPRLFRVTTRWAATVDIQALANFGRGGPGQEFPQEVIQCLDVALRGSMSLRPEVATFARGFFLPPGPRPSPSIGNGAEVWRGYSQSLRFEQLGLALNVDMAVSAFLEHGPVIDFLQRAAGLHDPRAFAHARPQQIGKASRAIFGVKVEVQRNGVVARRYRAKGLTAKGPREQVFHLEQTGEDVSVLEYYRTTYGIELRFPTVPCINVGTPRKPVWLPAELCYIVKGQRRLKLDERQTAEIIKKAAVRPQERKGWIEDCVRQRADLPHDPTLAAFQMRVEVEMVDVQGRLLPPPQLRYATQSVRPAPGKGAWNAQGMTFFKPAAITSFAVASFVDQQSAGGPVRAPASINAFFKDQLSACQSNGMALPVRISPDRGLPPEIVVFSDPRAERVGQTLERAYAAGKDYFRRELDIIFVVLPEYGANETYKEVKRASDSFLGVPSQCVKPGKAGIGTPRGSRGQYCGNLAMKINAKVKGINHKLLTEPCAWMKTEPFIVFGADVTHPLGLDSSIPSVAAVGLKEVVKELLIEFVRANKGVKPARIIFFRDGVSESEFGQVRQAEIPQIFSAVAELQQSAAARIPLTYIVCQKRHKTRLFPGEAAAADPKGNVLSGTCVDTQIVDPREFGYYLNSHASIQGTSRPGKFTLLLDQNGMSADELQRLSFWSTHLNCRCTRAVSLPPPVMYAHLAAFRGRQLLADVESDAGSVRGGGQGPVDVEYAKVNDRLHSTMFFV